MVFLSNSVGTKLNVNNNWEEDTYAWRKLHRKYTIGENVEDLLTAIDSTHKKGIKTSACLLGENVQSFKEASRVTEEYITLIDKIDGSKANISVKLSYLGLKPNNGQSYEKTRENLLKILKTASYKQVLVEIDMERVDLIKNTFRLARIMLKNRKTFRISTQTRLVNVLEYINSLKHTALITGTHFGLRIVTGACYNKIDNVGVDNNHMSKQFYHLIDWASSWQTESRFRKKIPSIIATQIEKRIPYAADKSIGFQFLKGEEQTPLFGRALELAQQYGLEIGLYAGIGKLKNQGVREYLWRRIQ
ncbi:MAG: proline dehydrogenase family protein [Promethearchaeota archaeon]